MGLGMSLRLLWRVSSVTRPFASVATSGPLRKQLLARPVRVVRPVVAIGRVATRARGPRPPEPCAWAFSSTTSRQVVASRAIRAVGKRVHSVVIMDQLPFVVDLKCGRYCQEFWIAFTGTPRSESTSRSASSPRRSCMSFSPMRTSKRSLARSTGGSTSPHLFFSGPPSIPAADYRQRSEDAVAASTSTANASEHPLGAVQRTDPRKSDVSVVVNTSS